jgi:type I restriction enzyme R subunit
MDLLISIQSDEYWQGVTIPSLEKLRLEIRELVKFLEKENRPIVYTDFEDEIGEWTIHDQTIKDYVDLSTYKKRVERFLKEHENFLVIQKLKTNLPITRHELESLEEMLFRQGKLGTKEDIKKVYGDQPLGKFVRSIVGLDVTAARAAFAGFLNNAAFNSQQIRFIDKIINFLTVNGTIDPGMLFETPFTDIHNYGLNGVFSESEARQIIRVIQEINYNALAG